MLTPRFVNIWFQPQLLHRQERTKQPWRSGIAVVADRLNASQVLNFVDGKTMDSKNDENSFKDLTKSRTASSRPSDLEASLSGCVRRLKEEELKVFTFSGSQSPAASKSFRSPSLDFLATVPRTPKDSIKRMVRGGGTEKDGRGWS